ncbi:hypothetical protein DV515_00015345 [Chloebia gouldiae]|uniref:Uncharacterized protein n=1 Tax=Chloebia gouldiae TaxID=44316 RepID=A0A3L8RVL5_CHLGU|nr:hypothetical protein DV515_00015345 [Chloebia gouldiae]
MVPQEPLEHSQEILTEQKSSAGPLGKAPSVRGDAPSARSPGVAPEPLQLRVMPQFTFACFCGLHGFCKMKRKKEEAGGGQETAVAGARPDLAEDVTQMSPRCHPGVTQVSPRCRCHPARAPRPSLIPLGATIPS